MTTADEGALRGRIGLIIPSSNRKVEDEMVRWFPVGVQPHVARLRMTGVHHVELEQLTPRVRDAAATLDDARCDAVVFHCTGTSMTEGSAGEQRLLAALREATSGRVGTTATAVLRALEAVAVRRLVLITPYTPEATAHEAEFLQAAGFEVARWVATDRGGSDGYAATPPSFWFEAVAAAADPSVDGYFLSCANIACFDQVEHLEATLGRPVITSNQAVLWWALRALGLPDRPALGRLLQT